MNGIHFLSLSIQFRVLQSNSPLIISMSSPFPANSNCWRNFLISLVYSMWFTFPLLSSIEVIHFQLFQLNPIILFFLPISISFHTNRQLLHFHTFKWHFISKSNDVQILISIRFELSSFFSSSIHLDCVMQLEWKFKIKDIDSSSKEWSPWWGRRWSLH